MNLGFVKIKLKNNEEYLTDLQRVKMNNSIKLDNTNYCINNINPYCARWIYNKEEFNKFINSKYYDINNIPDYQIREKVLLGYMEKVITGIREQ